MKFVLETGESIDKEDGKDTGKECRILFFFFFFFFFLFRGNGRKYTNFPFSRLLRHAGITSGLLCPRARRGTSKSSNSTRQHVRVFVHRSLEQLSGESYIFFFSLRNEFPPRESDSLPFLRIFSKRREWGGANNCNEQRLRRFVA